MIPIQKILINLGDSGCYFLSICNLANTITDKKLDIIKTFIFANTNKWIQDDCFVLNPEKLISTITKKTIKVRKEFNLGYEPKTNEFLIGCFQWNNYSHFVCLDRQKQISYDPLGNSNTCSKGTLQSLRVFEVVD